MEKLSRFDIAVCDIIIGGLVNNSPDMATAKVHSDPLCEYIYQKTGVEPTEEIRKAFNLGFGCAVASYLLNQHEQLTGEKVGVLDT